MVKLEFYDPSGTLDASKPHAARLPSLAGKRIGLIWNGKPGGDVALNVVAEHIGKRFPDASFWRSDWYSYPFTDGQLQSIVDHCDVAIGTTGD